MNRRIMSIDELYSFCIKNNFSVFNSDDFGKELVVAMPSSFERSSLDTDKMTEGLTPFKSKAFHDNVNLNKSKIANEAFKDNLPSCGFRPVLANIIKNEDTGEIDFGSHDYHIENVTITNDDGEEEIVEKVVYDEKPIGVIDGEKTSIEHDAKAGVNRAVLHGYLYNEYCQDAIDILNRRGTVDCSVELVIRKMSVDGKTRVLILEDFYVSGLTLLSAKTKPGMKGSNLKIEDFAMTEEIDDFNSKMIELQDRLNKLESACFNKEQDNVHISQKEGGNGMFEKLLKKYNKNIEDITFEYAELSDEELEAKFAEMFDDSNDNSAKPSENNDNNNSASDGDGDTSDEYSISVKCGSKEYAISLTEKARALCDLVNKQYAAEDNTWYYVTAYDNYVIMQDCCTGAYYRQGYSEEDEVLSLVDDRVSVFAEFLTQEEVDTLNEMRTNYSSVVDELNTYKAAEAYADKLSVFEDEAYAEYLETEEFKALMSQENVNEYSKEELVNMADIAFAKIVKKNKNFSLTTNSGENSSEKKKIKRVAFNAERQNEDTYRPYGSIIDK